MTRLRSAYTVDEKVVFRTVATATVFETFTYQVSFYQQQDSLCTRTNMKLGTVSVRVVLPRVRYPTLLSETQVV
jgi:predicted secreted Zn-dependent protease